VFVIGNNNHYINTTQVKYQSVGHGNMTFKQIYTKINNI